MIFLFNSIPCAFKSYLILLPPNHTLYQRIYFHNISIFNTNSLIGKYYIVKAGFFHHFKKSI